MWPAWRYFGFVTAHKQLSWGLESGQPCEAVVCQTSSLIISRKKSKFNLFREKKEEIVLLEKWF